MTELKEIRRRRHLTQAELAGKIGVTQSVVAMWERGEVSPVASKLPVIADVLGCTIDALFGREPPERTSA